MKYYNWDLLRGCRNYDGWNVGKFGTNAEFCKAKMQFLALKTEMGQFENITPNPSKKQTYHYLYLKKRYKDCFTFVEE